MAKISVVINTRNEEKFLEQTITSVKNWADEVVVVDMQSTDNSVKVAKKLGARVISHRPIDYVEPARNFAISKAKNDWILILDPDEQISKDLKKRLSEIADSGKVQYVRIPRKNIIFGKWIRHSRWWPDYNIRFFKKGSVEWDETIHAVPMTKGEGLDLEDEEKLAIIHNHYQSIDQYVERMNRYTTVQAQLLVREHKKFEWRNLFLKPMSEFTSRFFSASGFKDGLHGLALAMLQASSEMVVQLKLWQLEKFPDKQLPLKSVIAQMREVETDLHYWYADALFRENKSLVNRLRRKFKI